MELSYRIRELLEPMLLAESIPHLTEQDFAEMREVKAKLEQVTDATDQVRLTTQQQRSATAQVVETMEQLSDASRQVSLHRGAWPAASSGALAAKLMGREPSPSHAAREAEQQRCLQQALDRMDPLDREVVALRHFEQLTNAETAQVLGLEVSAASKRYVRALQRLKEILAAMPGGLGEE